MLYAPGSRAQLCRLRAPVALSDAAAEVGDVGQRYCGAPPAMTTEKVVPVKAPVDAPSVTLNVQIPVAGPLSVNTPVFASALTQ